jgi:hypothetical protein
MAAMNKTPVAGKQPATANAGTALVLRIPPNARVCEGARLLADRKLDPADAPALPLSSCGSLNCPCRYERVAKRRSEERRGESARRESIRFETKEDRRKRSDPRDVWTKTR